MRQDNQSCIRMTVLLLASTQLIALSTLNTLWWLSLLLRLITKQRCSAKSCFPAHLALLSSVSFFFLQSAYDSHEIYRINGRSLHVSKGPLIVHCKTAFPTLLQSGAVAWENWYHLSKVTKKQSSSKKKKGGGRGEKILKTPSKHGYLAFGVQSNLQI